MLNLHDYENLKAAIEARCINDIYNIKDGICTPMECVEKMINYIPNSFWNSNIKVLDPCCGNGNFDIYCATKIDESQITCTDINDERLAFCKEILKNSSVKHQDFLDQNFNESFNLIVANPPYSGGGNKNRSLSLLFINKTIDLLIDKGYLCFIAPNNWMSYNNNNKTLKKLLTLGSFLVIDNQAKKYFKGIGSSFTIFVWQKGVLNNRATVFNSYMKTDCQKDIIFTEDLPCIPLYISNETLNLIKNGLCANETGFKYRCDLHATGKKQLLSPIQTDEYKYKTLHTERQVKYSKIKQDIFDKYLITISFSNYFNPTINHNVNVTQDTGYYEFNSLEEAEKFKKLLEAPSVALVIKLTRYGNFNNVSVIKHLNLKYLSQELISLK